MAIRGRDTRNSPAKAASQSIDCGRTHHLPPKTILMSAPKHPAKTPTYHHPDRAGHRPVELWRVKLGTRMHPQSLYGHVVAMIEIFVGLMSLALITGIMFARFSRPKARFLFSRIAVVRPHHARHRQREPLSVGDRRIAVKISDGVHPQRERRLHGGRMSIFQSGHSRLAVD